MGKSYEGDYELEEAFRTIQMPFPYEGTVNILDLPLINDPIEEYYTIAESFTISIARNISLWTLPAEIIFWIQFKYSCQYRARLEMGLDVNDSSKDGTEEWYEKYKNIHANDFLRQASSPGVRQFQAKVRSVGFDNLKVLLEEETDTQNPIYKVLERFPISDGIEAILATMMLSSYVSFETLATDLWIAAVNRHSKLAVNFINSSKGNLSKKFSISDSISMGDLLYNKNEAKFLRYSTILNNYRDAFGEEINSVFTDEVNARMRKTEQIRHLIVHRGGVVDSKFKRAMKGTIEFDQYNINDRLNIDGPLVQDSTYICINTGADLLRFVDKFSRDEDQSGI